MATRETHESPRLTIIDLKRAAQKIDPAGRPCADPQDGKSAAQGTLSAPGLSTGAAAGAR